MRGQEETIYIVFNAENDAAYLLHFLRKLRDKFEVKTAPTKLLSERIVFEEEGEGLLI